MTDNNWCFYLGLLALVTSELVMLVSYTLGISTHNIWYTLPMAGGFLGIVGGLALAAESRETEKDN